MTETTPQAADVKNLTRNPLIPWKRLVEMNLNSILFSNGAENVTEKCQGHGFDVSSGRVPEYLGLTISECGGALGKSGHTISECGGALGTSGHTISECGGALGTSGCCPDYLVTEKSDFHIDKPNAKMFNFEEKQNKRKHSFKNRHVQPISLNGGKYIQENLPEGTDTVHQRFNRNELYFKQPSTFQERANNLNSSDAITNDNMDVRENELRWEQELKSASKTNDSFKNCISCLDGQITTSNLNSVDASDTELAKNPATDYKIQGGEYTCDADSEMNCSRLEDSGIITHTDGLPCSVNENTILESGGESDWDLSFEEDTCVEFCSDDNDAVYPKEKTYQIPNVFFSEGFRDVSLESNLRELEMNRPETTNRTVENVMLQRTVHIRERSENLLNRPAWQTGHYCDDQEDFVQSSPLLNYQSRVSTFCEPYVNNVSGGEIIGVSSSSSSEQKKENDHGHHETDNHSNCFVDYSEIDKAKHNEPNFLSTTEIEHKYDCEQGSESQDATDNGKSLKTGTSDEIIKTNGALAFSSDDIVSGENNNENLGSFLTKKVCAVEPDKFEYNENPAALSNSDVSGFDATITIKEYITSTNSIPKKEREPIVCCSGELENRGRQECAEENLIGNFLFIDDNLKNNEDNGHIDEKMISNLELDNLDRGKRSVCIKIKVNPGSPPHDQYTQFDKLKSWEEHDSNLKRLTRDPLICWKRLVDINIESMLPTKHDCAEGVVHSSKEGSKQTVKSQSVIFKSSSNIQNNTKSHLEYICSGDKYNVLQDLDVNDSDMGSSIFNVNCGDLSKDTKIERDLIQEDDDLKITFEHDHEMSPKFKTEINYDETDDDVKEYTKSNIDNVSEIEYTKSNSDNVSEIEYIKSNIDNVSEIEYTKSNSDNVSEIEYTKSNIDNVSEIEAHISQDILSQENVELFSEGLNVFSNRDESEEEFYHPYQFERELDSGYHQISDMTPEIASSASLDTKITERYDDSTHLQANGNLLDHRSDSMAKSEQVIEDLKLKRNQLSFAYKINNGLMGVTRNIGKHIQSRHEKIGHSTNKLSVANWLNSNRTAKWGKKECNILLSTASQAPETSVRLVLGNNNLSTACSKTFDGFHSVPETPFKTHVSNTELCDKGSEDYRSIITSDFLLESDRNEIVSQHQIPSFEVNISESEQHKSSADGCISIQPKTTNELCTNEFPDSFQNACVEHGTPRSGWTWFTNVVTKIVSSIKSGEHPRDDDMESLDSTTADNEVSPGVETKNEVLLNNFNCEEKNLSEINKPVTEECPQDVCFVETNRTYGREMASGEKSDISFTEYISRHAIDSSWIRKHINATKTTSPPSTINDYDDDMATTVQMVLDSRRGVKNPKLQRAYEFIRGRKYTSSSSEYTEDISPVISIPSKQEQRFHAITNKTENPVHTSPHLRNNMSQNLVKKNKKRKQIRNAFTCEKLSLSKEIQNSQQALETDKNETRLLNVIKPIPQTHKKKDMTSRNNRREPRHYKKDVYTKLTQGNYDVGFPASHDDVSPDVTSSGEYNSDIQFSDSCSDGWVIDTKLVSNEEVLSEYFRNKDYNMKPMVTTKDIPKPPLHALTVPSVPHHQTSQDMMSARDLVSSPVNCMTRSASIDLMSVDTMESGDTMLKDDLFQSSLECLLEMLLQRGKVSDAFVASMKGEILAKTSGLVILTEDVMTLICSLTSNYSGTVKISLMTLTYTCFKDDLNSAVIGKAENSIFVARLGKENIVVGFSDPCTPGSCIREIQELSTALSQRGL